MAKKSAVCLTLAFVLILGFFSATLAQENAELRKAYDWLFMKTKTKLLWDDLNIKQHVFSLLALSCNESSLKLGNESLYGKAWKSASFLCWGEKKASLETDCRITETALAKFAVDKHLLFDTKRATDWLLNKSIFFKDIFWFLELDIARGLEAECRISYGGTNATVFINENKTLSNLSQGSPACFEIYDSYWLRIKPDCYEKSFKIRCAVENNEPFRITLKYKKSLTSPIWYVSADSWSLGSLDEREVWLESYCLGLASCDYEGTAWAAYALKTAGSAEAKKFIPYLVIAKEDNEQYLPAALLYLNGITRYGVDIERLQNPQGFWKALPTTAYGQFYDTALAGMTGLGNLSDSKGGARYYLTVDCDKAGTFVKTADRKYRYWKCTEYNCNDVRDTAFLLWTFWKEHCYPEVVPGLTCEGYGYSCSSACLPDEVENVSLTPTCSAGLICCMPGIVPEACEGAGGYCTEEYSCPKGEFQLNKTCPSVWQICCKKYSDAKCNEFGTECSADQKCTVDTVKDAYEVDCCPGECVPREANQSCSELNGEICEENEVCIDESTWTEADFAPSTDARCCVGKCVEDVRCSDKGGVVCSATERCSVATVETKDYRDCCVGTCQPTKTCSLLGGVKCPKEKCDGTFKEASDGDCCIGKCKKAIWWLWLLIIVIVAAALLYFYKFRKPKKKPPAAAMAPIVKRPLIPITPTRAPPAAAPPKPIPFRPLPSKPPSGPPTVPSTKAPPKALSKTEAELEKTLKKLKGMTKK